jgi:hypothetical protein
MTLQEQLQQQLTGSQPFSSGEQVLEASEGARSLRCELVALDSLACAFTRLSLRSDALRQLSSAQLRAAAEGLAKRLTYLLEPIRPIEVDAEGAVVQLRSDPPHKETDRTSYYELLLSRGCELSLVRYARPAGQPRQPIAAQVTREVLVRLAGDLADAV